MVNPCAGSEMETTTLSPGLIISVWLFGVKVLTFVSCGLGGPAGTPLVCRYAKLTGSVQLGLRWRN